MFFRMVYKSGQIFLPFCHNARCRWTNRRRSAEQSSWSYAACIRMQPACRLHAACMRP